MPKRAEPDDASLKRLGGGRWQTRDERFTIEPQSGTWVVVDAEQADDLGLPLVRGPFPSLTAAKEAIAGARGAAQAESPLARKIADRTGRPAADESDRQGARRSTRAKAADENPAEPAWLTDLKPPERRRARQLIERLTAAGAPDPDGLVRRDLVGDVPTVAAYALRRAMDGLRSDAGRDRVAELLADGRDEDLDVRWRLVDGEGRPIRIE
jgi:hypothetical protein